MVKKKTLKKRNKRIKMKGGRDTNETIYTLLKIDNILFLPKTLTITGNLVDKYKIPSVSL